MSVPAKLLGFGAALIAAFGLGAGIGTAVGPLGTDAPNRDHQSREERPARLRAPRTRAGPRGALRRP